MIYTPFIENPEKYFPEEFGTLEKETKSYLKIMNKRYVPTVGDPFYAGQMARQFATVANEDPKVKNKRESLKRSSRVSRRIRGFVHNELEDDRKALEERILTEFDDLFYILQHAKATDPEAFEKAEWNIFQDFKFSE